MHLDRARWLADLVKDLEKALSERNLGAAEILATGVLNSTKNFLHHLALPQAVPKSAAVIDFAQYKGKGAKTGPDGQKAY